MALITNKFGVPQAIVNAMRRFAYSKGASDVSVTEVLKPPRMRCLMIAHDHEIEVDASDRLFSLLGSALHEVLSRKAGPDDVAEERLFMPCEGWIISGQIDVQRDSAGQMMITDYKLTSVAGYEMNRPEWEQQLNLYRVLVERVKGIRVDALQICVILRDWRKLEAVRDKSYPQCPVQLIPIPMWELEEAERFMRQRVAAHQAAELNSDLLGEDSLPECTDEERWLRASAWAVQKPGAQRASRVFLTQWEAEEYAAGKPGYEIVERKGKPTRCMHFCDAAPHCSQYAAWLRENQPDMMNDNDFIFGEQNT